MYWKETQGFPQKPHKSQETLRGMHGTCLYRSHLRAVTEKEQVTSRCLAWERRGMHLFWTVSPIWKERGSFLSVRGCTDKGMGRPGWVQCSWQSEEYKSRSFIQNTVPATNRTEHQDPKQNKVPAPSRTEHQYPIEQSVSSKQIPQRGR